MVFPKIIAHRGASAYAPENTLAAFKKAHQLGCRFVEFDVVLTNDDKALVFHDENIKRTTNGRGKISKLDYDYLVQLDAGSWFSPLFKGEQIPTLEQAIKFLGEHQMQANIELKPGKGAEQQTAVMVLSAVNQFWPTQTPRPVISSFNHKALECVRTFDPDIPMGYLMDSWKEKGLLEAREMACVSIHCNAKILSKKRVAKIKEAGFQLLAYTVNKKKLAEKLYLWGVDSVFSDYPDLLA